MGQYLPKGESLFPHQVVSLKELLARDGNLFLCDEPGRGKTVTAIVYMNVKKYKRVLIVSKRNGIAVWKKHLEQWHLSKPKIRIYHPDDPYFDADVLLTHYHWLSFKELASEIINHFKYDLLILDEPHVIRHISSSRGRYLFCKNGIVSRAKQTLAVTGTVLFNRVEGLYVLLKGIRPDVIEGMTKHEFGMRYCAGYFDNEKGQYDYSGASNVEELSDLLHRTCLVGTIFSGQGAGENLESPEIEYLTPATERVVDLIKRSKVFDETYKVQRPSHALRLLGGPSPDSEDEVASIRRELGESKIPEAAYIIKREVKLYGKVIVFAYHRSVVKGLAELLPRARHLLGGMPKKKVDQIIEDFQTNPKVRVLVASITAFSDTVTLTASRRPVFVELSYIWNENYQAIMRTRPALQAAPVKPLFLTYAESYDERILLINHENKKIQKRFNPNSQKE